jgi:hypothetical protein
MVFEANDKHDRATHVLVARGTFALDGAAPRLAQHQRPLVMADEHHGEPACSATRDESDLAPTKPATDVLLRGTARAPGGAALPAWEVGIEVGSLRKRARVTGPRWWTRAGDDRWTLGAPLPCAAVPLRYELAYGGAVSDGAREERCEANPVGVGFAPAWWLREQRRVAAPQVEAVDAPIGDILGAYAPEGFGPVGRSWLPRRQRAGTLDDRWLAERWPVMPDDFDDAYWNCAPPGLTAPGYLRGDEAVHVWGVHPDGALRFALPGHYVYALFRYEDGVMRPYPMMLDTVTVDVDLGELAMVWRLTAPLAPAVRVMELRMDFRDPGGP